MAGIATHAMQVSEWIRPYPPAEDAHRERKLAAAHAFCARLGRLAVRSLYDELTLYPKPGLVSLVDNGSHRDMNAETFMRSLFALRHYFIRIAKAGADGAAFTELRQLGIDAEQKMLHATRGINTHRGAIFCLGLLCAAAGYCHAHRIRLSPQALRAVLLMEWGQALTIHARATDGSSHGLQVAARHAASGAREEAALGLPSVFEVALPALQSTLETRACWERARIDALFALMAYVSDTNVYYRGGTTGAAMVRSMAQEFLVRGGTAHAQWKTYALECHRQFISRKLSPGGAADLLAAACLVHRLTYRLGGTIAAA
ncbi:triphosphoribosyl-dephospho-CoA synthase MdcB [Noviherbaspirillum massiliense]|uniref:triphosphoribosyl-dephospho-CoA synthase MdcB n=1 Tax=Noviherbaspirillum massiliense TaxID=1465823 RepID=UPI000313EEA2|nr:triphosphoribosyl-dephospho-CoA synthase MdcB [Noviherbaspirillum massiliense]